MTVLKNVTAMWAAIKQPDTYSEKYEVTMAHLNADQVKTLKELGATVTECDKEGDNYRGMFARAKSKFPPKVFYQKEPFEGNIGNGSICNVAFGVGGGGKGKFIGLQLNKINVLKLVEYESGPGEDDDDLFDGADTDGLMDDDELTV